MPENKLVKQYIVCVQFIVPVCFNAIFNIVNMSLNRIVITAKRLVSKSVDYIGLLENLQIKS